MGIFIQSNRLHSLIAYIEEKITRIVDSMWWERKSSNKHTALSCRFPMRDFPSKYQIIQLYNVNRSKIHWHCRHHVGESAKIQAKVQHDLADSLRRIFLQGNRLHSYTTSTDGKVTIIADIMWGNAKVQTKYSTTLQIP